MIDVKCSKAQYERLINYLNDAGYVINGKCVLGHGYPCQGVKEKITCKECLYKNIRLIKDKM